MGIVTTNGPAEQVTAIVNAKWAYASENFQKAIEFSDKALADIEAPPDMQFDPKIALPPPLMKPSLMFSDADESMEYFNTKNAELSALIDDAFNKILGIAFPDMAAIGKALAWCVRAIEQGGTGINQNVEGALWERGRARVLKQAQRDIAGIQAKYARAGWPLPPGAMLHESSMIQQDSRDKLAEMSRDIAVKSFDTEVENVRFAVKTIMDQFSQALQAVGDYVKTVMLGPQIAMDMARSLAGLKNDAARTLVSLYQAQAAAQDPFVRVGIANAELGVRVGEQNLKATLEAAQTRTNVAMAQIKMVGDTAAASLNGIGASVSNSMSADGGFSGLP